MATLHVLCGLPGSGKTTLAKELEKQHSALRLTSDEWMERIVGDGFNDEKKNVVEQIQGEVAQRVLQLGIDVILDFGVWSRKERDVLRAKAKEVGAKTKLYFLDVPYSELLSRLEKRNMNLPPRTFHITKEHMEKWTHISKDPHQMSSAPPKNPTQTTGDTRSNRAGAGVYVANLAARIISGPEPSSGLSTPRQGRDPAPAPGAAIHPDSDDEHWPRIDEALQ